MGKFVTVVSGFGRCGSTAMMKAIHAGGIAPYQVMGGSYEHPALDKVISSPRRFSKAKNKSLKVLEPHPTLPANVPHRIIFMTRDHHQQAVSSYRFCSLMFGDIFIADEATAISKFYHSLDLDLRKVKKRSNHNVLFVSFDDLLMSPERELLKVANFLCLPSEQVSLMASQIIKRGSIADTDPLKMLQGAQVYQPEAA